MGEILPKRKRPTPSDWPLIPILDGLFGLEPATPTMSRWCSNQLSYASAMEAHSTEKRLCVNTLMTNYLKLRQF